MATAFRSGRHRPSGPVRRWPVMGDSPRSAGTSRFPCDRRGGRTGRIVARRIDECSGLRPAGRTGPGPAVGKGRARRQLPDADGCDHHHKVCGSGMKATMLAHDIITQLRRYRVPAMRSYHAPLTAGKGARRLSRRHDRITIT